MDSTRQSAKLRRQLARSPATGDSCGTALSAPTGAFRSGGHTAPALLIALSACRYLACLHRSGRFSVSPSLFVQVLSVAPVKGPTVSSWQSCSPLCFSVFSVITLAPFPSASIRIPSTTLSWLLFLASVEETKAGLSGACPPALMPELLMR